MASARQRKVGSAFKAARSSCIRETNTVSAFDSCMSKTLKTAIKKIDGPRRKPKAKRKTKRR